MPEQEQFWNPYRMIGSHRDVLRCTPNTHEKFQGICGNITGTVETLTPLWIGSRGDRNNREKYFFQTRNRKCIPATSFKGMLRSLLEIVGKGCTIVGSNASPCDNTDNLCAACRLFGMSLSGHTNILFQGKVYIGDLHLLENFPGAPPSVRVVCPSPNPSHKAFYGNNNNRKLYHHQKATWTNAGNSRNQNMGANIRPIPEERNFSLNIRVENMTEQELGLLLYCLELEQNLTIEIEEPNNTIITLTGNMHHKLGGAKALGYGSIAVHVIPDAKDFFRPSQRYKNCTDQSIGLDTTTWQNIQNEKNKYHLGKQYDNDVLKELRAMLLFPVDDSRLYRYPEDAWFHDPQNPKNAKTKLKKIYQRFII